LSSKFNVVFTGLQEGITEDDFVTKFCQKFGLSEEKARKMSASNSDITIKKDLDQDKAKQYLTALENCGMIARLDEITAEPELDSGLSLTPIKEDESIENTAKVVCPKCGSEQIMGDECQACGIFISKYLADQENITVTHEEEFSSEKQFESTNEASNPYATPAAELSDSDELQPERVSIGSGIQWLSGGFWHFKQNPFAWIGAIVVFFALFFILALIPFLGGLMTNILSPVIMAGFALGAHEQQEGGDFRVSHLFAGFSNNVGQLMLVGVFYLIALIVIGVVAALLMGGTLAASGMMSESAGMDPNTMAALMQPGMLIMMLIIFSVVILLTMAYYFAPILIALEGMNALGAMAMSFRACLKNWLAFIIYGLLLMVLFFIASIPVFLGLLIAIPMVQAAIYVSYRDIFHHEY